MIKTASKFVLLIVVAGTAGYLLGGHLTPVDNWQDALMARLAAMAVVAALIERSVEVYLNAADRNGDSRFGERQARSDAPSARQSAAVAAMVLGLLVSLSGLGVLGAMFTLDARSSSLPLWASAVLFRGADVVVSGGLMAGGAALFHELAETIRGGLRTLSLKAGPTPTATTMLTAPAATAAARTWRIEVRRDRPDSGTLSFSGNGLGLVTTCWWAADKRIAAGVYTQASKTRMASKPDSVTGERRPAIFLPTALAPDTGNATIFIHEGKDPSWSDGCLVIERDRMLQLWHALPAMDAHDITVEVIDA